MAEAAAHDLLLTPALPSVTRASELTAERRKEREEALLGSLPNYSGSGDLRQAIEDYIAERLPFLAGGRPHVEQLPVGPLTGLSGRPIFRAFDVHGRLVAFIKGYRLDRPKFDGFSRLVSSAELLSSLTLKESHAIKVLGLGLSHRHAFVVLSAAPGESLACMLHQLSELSASPERDALRKTLLQGMRLAGRALAEFHLSPPKQPGAMSPFFRAREFKVCQWLPPSLRDLGEPLEPFLSALDKARHLEDVNPGRITYVHGDAHPGNFVFDPETQTVSLVDIGNISYSVGEDLEPRGPAAYDFTKMQAWTEIQCRHSALCREDVAALQEAFAIGYNELAPLPPEEAQSYWRLICWGIAVAVRADSPASDFDESATIVDIALDQLKAEISALS